MIRRRPVVIANDIRLRRSQHVGPFLVVEGRDDRLFCQRFVDAESSAIVVAENKENVCDVIQILDSDGFAGAVGVIDADFDQIEGRTHISANIVTTDLHDIECMMLQSTALEVVLSELGSRQKLLRFGRDVRDALLAAASPIGYLRLHSRRQGLALRFDGLSYARCVDEGTLEIDRVALIQEVRNRSRRRDIGIEGLLEGIGVIEAEANDGWHVCAGVDLLGILSLGLRRTLGTNNSTSVRDEQLRQALRLAYHNDHFAQTQLCRLLQAWEGRNAAFRILRGN
jgi:Protein of unknown function (DUF4435)